MQKKLISFLRVALSPVYFLFLIKKRILSEFKIISVLTSKANEFCPRIESQVYRVLFFSKSYLEYYKSQISVNNYYNGENAFAKSFGLFSKEKSELKTLNLNPQLISKTKETGC